MKAPGRLALVAFLLMGSSAAIGQSLTPEPVPKPNPEDLKRGAVLCMWQIYMAVRESGEICHASEDPAFQAEMNTSVEKIEKFIVDNGHPPAGYISTRESQAHAMGNDKQVCTNIEGFYQAFKRAGPKKIKAQTDFMLAVPRVPVMNPCL